MGGGRDFPLFFSSFPLFLSLPTPGEQGQEKFNMQLINRVDVFPKMDQAF